MNSALKSLLLFVLLAAAGFAAEDFAELEREAEADAAIWQDQEFAPSRSGNAEDFAQLKRAAERDERGDATWQIQLGLAYATGRGVPLSYTEAVKWFRKQAERGDARAQYYLGVMYGNGAGVPKDRAEAEEWIRKAAKQNFGKGLRMLRKIQEARERKAAREQENARQQKVAALSSVEQRASYGMGYDMGSGIVRWGELTVDEAALKAGLNDGLTKAEPPLPVADIQAALNTLEERKTKPTAEAAPRLTSDATVNSHPRWLITVDQRACYGIGYNMGSGIAQQGWGGFTVDQAALVAGLNDGLTKAEPPLPRADIQAAFTTLEERKTRKKLDETKRFGEQRNAGPSLPGYYNDDERWAKIVDEALKLYGDAAEQGDVIAQYNLGWVYSLADGKFVEAIKWYELAANQGDAKAQFRLGKVLSREQALWFNNPKVREKPDLSGEWFRKAADQGYAPAQLSLGDSSTNIAEKVQWYRKAADQGNIKAQVQLGDWAYDGYEVLKDYEEALKWYRLAAEQGNAEAQAKLGHMYANSEGLEQDLVWAHAWLNLAVVNGSGSSATELKMIELLMSPENKQKAMKLARELLAKLPKGK